ncbi:hypothetical protein, partial [Bradyrhizobium sp.]|uniref:hypothetical protein n=1 Tax=Bradyrhizobium sp. TaxID=376 RepID=UPI0025C04D62
FNSAHIHGTDVPVEEPSTASTPEVADSTTQQNQPGLLNCRGQQPINISRPPARQRITALVV